MTMTWEISDGSPNFWMSDAIVVMDPATPLASGFNPQLPGAPGVNDPPSAGTACHVWVRVQRFGALDAPPNDTQTGKVRLFAGRAGSHFKATDYDNYKISGLGANALLLDPPIEDPPTSSMWDTDGWNDNLTGSYVVPIRHEVSLNNWTTEYVLDKNSTFLPDDGHVRWLRFEWEDYRVPAAATDVGWHTCLMAYVYDPEAAFPGTGSAYVESYSNIAQSNFGIAAKRGAVKRRVLLGNSASRESRLGVRVWAEGPAADGALIKLRFTEPRQVLGRLSLGDAAPGEIVLPRPTYAMRPAMASGFPELRSAPTAWGVQRQGGVLHLAPRDAGFRLPISSGELLEAELTVLPGPGGDALTVHVVQFDSQGCMPGGVSFEVRAR